MLGQGSQSQLIGHSLGTIRIAHRIITGAISVVILALLLPNVFGQSSEAVATPELKALRAGLDASKANPSARQKPAIYVNIEGARTLGDKTSGLVMVEFSDFECP